MATEPKHDFFISYNHADKAWAEWIAWQLETAGYRVFVQAWDFRPGGNFVQAMQEGTSKADRTIAVLSPDYLTAEFTQPEWQAAFAKDPTGEKGLLVPVRVRECKPEGLFPQIIYVDLLGLVETKAREALLAGVVRGRAKPKTPPAFPASTASAPPFPGALPRLWNLPLRNHHFTGREDLLADVHAALTSNQAAALTQAQAITGLGGIGKSQLAIEYAYRHADEYDVVWWVRAEEPAQLASDYAALAVALDPSLQEEPDQGALIAAARQWLEHGARWLLLLDNVGEAKALKDYLPRGGAGHVLITSLDPNWGGVATAVAVQTLPRPESVALLEKWLGRSDPLLDELADELGDFPLALAQAGAYLEETRLSVADYLDLFRKRRAELWQEEHPPRDYPDTVATTWSLSMTSLQSECPAALDLLRLCAYLAPDDIPLAVLREQAKRLPESLAAVAGDQLAVSHVVAALRRYSLVTVEEDLLSLHRLLQAVVRDGLSDDERIWARAAVETVSAAFPREPEDVRSWPTCAFLLPHALSAVDWAKGCDLAIPAASRVHNQVGVYLFGRAQLAEARAHLEQALRIDEEAGGPDHPHVATDVSNLGRVLHALGDLSGARAHAERALRISERTHGPDHPAVAACVSNLGTVLLALGDLQGARMHFERALRSAEQTPGRDHPAVAIYANNLGTVLQALGDLRGARAHLDQALRIDEQVYGPDHPMVAIRLSNLGSVLRDLGDLPGARAHSERALRIGEQAYGPDHPAVAIRANSLGCVLRDLGDLPGARAHFERALRIDEQAYGPDHPTVAIRLCNLGMVLWALGDLPGARVHFDRALCIDEQAYGPDHPEVAMGAWGLGTVLRDLGDLPGARSRLRQALRILNASLGDDHPKTALVRENLASLDAAAPPPSVPTPKPRRKKGKAQPPEGGPTP
jgi:tetratricopeptide (TPR) repeat protein